MRIELALILDEFMQQYDLNKLAHTGSIFMQKYRASGGRATHALKWAPDHSVSPPIHHRQNSCCLESLSTDEFVLRFLISLPSLPATGGVPAGEAARAREVL